LFGHPEFAGLYQNCFREDNYLQARLLKLRPYKPNNTCIFRRKRKRRDNTTKKEVDAGSDDYQRQAIHQPKASPDYEQGKGDKDTPCLMFLNKPNKLFFNYRKL
jgi:hypothetical protein